MSANIGRPFLRGRAQYLPKAKTVCGGAFLLWAHFSFLGECVVDVWNGILGDLSGSLERGRAQISRDLVGAIHESPAIKLGFIGELGKR